MSTTKQVERKEDIGQAAVNSMLDIHSGFNPESFLFRAFGEQGNTGP